MKKRSWFTHEPPERLVTTRVVAEVALLTNDGRRDAAASEGMVADGDSEPQSGTHGAADLDLTWCHRDSHSLQHAVGVGADPSRRMPPAAAVIA